MKQVKFKDFINYDERIGKMIIAGVEGSGKTLLLSRIAVGKMQHGIEDCWKSWDEVDFYNSLGMNLSKNYEHLCFANYDINCEGTEIPFQKVYRCNPYRLGLFDKSFPTDFLPPYALICVTEGYNYLNSYFYDKFRDSVRAWLKTCRQAKYDMVVDCHAFADICTIFRRLTNRFIFLYKKVEDIKNKDGIIVGHKLFIREWNDWQEMERYFGSKSKIQNYEEYELIIDMCMHDNYDTNYCKYLHLLGRKMQDFFIQHFSEITNVDEIEGMLEEFGVIAPEGYFVSKGSKSKSEKSSLSSPDEEEFGFENFDFGE